MSEDITCSRARMINAQDDVRTDLHIICMSLIECTSTKLWHNCVCASTSLRPDLSWLQSTVDMNFDRYEYHRSCRSFLNYMSTCYFDVAATPGVPEAWPVARVQA